MEINDYTSQVKQEGFCVVEDFLIKEELAEVLKEFDACFEKIPHAATATLDSPSNLNITGESKTGKHLRVSRGGYTGFPALLKKFNTPEWYELVSSYCGNQADFLLQIFMSQDYIVQSSLGDRDRQHWLHFDPYPSLKFLLYLTDTNIDNGASGIVRNSRALGTKYRNQLNLSDRSGWAGGCRHRLEDWEKTPTYSNKDVEYLCVKAGTVLILDTDTLHCGGATKQEGSPRKCIILHNRPAGLKMPLHDPA